MCGASLLVEPSRSLAIQGVRRMTIDGSYDETPLSVALRLRLRWWAFLAWLRRCPECNLRGYSTASPRWADDKVAQMLGIAQYGCPECGKGAIEEWDATTPADRAPGTAEGGAS
jgi:hypothetical protein